MSESFGWYRYVPHDQVKAYEALGWVCEDCPEIPHRVLHAYRVIMEWKGKGDPKEPSHSDKEKEEA